MLTVKCQGCGAVYRLSEDLYSRKAAGFGVVVTCRRCRAEIHVESVTDATAPAPEHGDGSAVEAAMNVSASEATDEVTPPKQTTPAPPSPMVVAKAPTQATASARSAKATAPWPAADLTPPTPPVAAVAEAATAPAPSFNADAPLQPTESVAATPALTPTAPLAQRAPAETAERSSPKAAESPLSPGAVPRPAARQPTPKFAATKSPGSGPFVALSPGLLSAGRPEPLPDSEPPISEAPIDSADFIDDKKANSPKAPPVRRPLAPSDEQSAKPTRHAEVAPPHKGKEPPKPPKQRPRPPTRSDASEHSSADVLSEVAPPAEAEVQRIVAPDSSALAAPPPRSEPPQKQPRSAGSSATASDASATSAKAKKSSTLVPVVLLALGAAGAFALAFRSQLPDDTEATGETPGAVEAMPPEAAERPPAPVPSFHADEPAAAEATAAPPTATASTAERALDAAGATTSAQRAVTPSSPGTSAPASSGTTAAKPAVTAPAQSAPEPADEPRAVPEGPFNAEAARAALASAVAQASSCRKPGDPSGVAAVTITFSPSGRVTSATVAGPPFAGTATGGCIAATLRRARVPPFEGDMVTVRKTVEIQ